MGKRRDECLGRLGRARWTRCVSLVRPEVAELDRDRDAADARVEAATARALLMLKRREQDRTRLAATTAELGEALQALLGEDVGVNSVAARPRFEMPK